MTRFMFVTDHVMGGKSMATMQFLAAELKRREFEVSFLTTGYSRLSILRNDYRTKERARLGYQYEHQGISCVFPVKLYHAQNFHNPVINKIADLVYSSYGQLYASDLNRFEGEPDFIIIESGYSVLLFQTLRRRYPRARLVYWVSDDPASLRMHDIVLKADRILATDLDVVVVIVSRGMRDRYSQSVYIEKGIAVDAFNRPMQDPYLHAPKTYNVVSIGTMLFDRTTLEAAATLLPNFNFYVIGPEATRHHPQNVKYFGTMSFLETIPYIKYADVGLAPYFHTEGIEYISQSSLKIAQYSYCRRPIVCPTFASLERPGFYRYSPSDPVAMADALNAAAVGVGAELDNSVCLPWTQVADRLLLRLHQESRVRVVGESV